MVVETCVYGAYGEATATVSKRRAGYAGGIVEPSVGWYMLGQRIYSPILRRFPSPDALSPFDAGGVNRYAYCGGDPIGRVDPEGQSWVGWFIHTLGEMTLSPRQGVAKPNMTYDFAMPTSSAVAGSSTESLSALSSSGSMQDLYNNSRKVVEDYVLSLDGKVRSPSKRGKVDILGGQYAILWPYEKGARATTVFRSDQRTVTIIAAKNPFFDDPGRSRYFARQQLVPKWRVFDNDVGGHHVVSGSSVTMAFLNPLVKQLEKTFKDQTLTLLAGAHGRPNGMNWLPDGSRIGTERKFFDKVASMAERNGWNATVKNYADIDSREFRDMLTQQKGVFVHITCYGAADVELMKAFHVQNVEIRFRQDV
ncbi:RHS repeat-associated core domain-containing protein [Luteibacter sp. CQ10]|uniref:RHS repeat-associated core domain-containing protein n=1 Tax=Luteibacter sp. CQ10 TaxID=2805821 RepID=UPI0034A238D3